MPAKQGVSQDVRIAGEVRGISRRVCGGLLNHLATVFGRGSAKAVLYMISRRSLQPTWHACAMRI